MASVLVSTLITDSYQELGVLDAIESPSAEMGQFALRRLNQLLDNWNADADAIYVQTFRTLTFVANQQDYTIGPSGADFTSTTARPVSILAANVLLDNVSPVVSNPITVRDIQWWTNLTVRTVTTTFPTDVYYSPGWPNGTLHFWPKPTTAYGLELVYNALLSAVVYSDTITLPVGYQNALMLTLAEDIAPAFAIVPTPITVTKAREARARIQANNTFVPRLSTQDSGMPSNSRNRCAWNYRSGMPMGR